MKDLEALFSESPLDLQNIDPEDLDKEILRLSIIAELDATSLYEQMAAMTKNNKIRKVLLDVAKEEKTHVGEFQSLLLEIDSEQAEELEIGGQEVDEIKTGGSKMREQDLNRIVSKAVREVLGQEDEEIDTEEELLAQCNRCGWIGEVYDLNMSDLDDVACPECGSRNVSFESRFATRKTATQETINKAVKEVVEQKKDKTKRILRDLDDAIRGMGIWYRNLIDKNENANAIFLQSPDKDCTYIVSVTRKDI